ncbi:MAG: heavy-metal-associated domain-containing protein [Candidatus Omnitrophica bacterium]|nr:heavy-metal-associated domain-containing protein [Candidatus Omnitrophota bacterium]
MVRQGQTRSILLLATLIVAVFVGLNLYTYAGGYSATALLQKAGEKQIVIPVEGMSCFTCELSVQKALGGLKGVTSSKASAKKGSVAVSYDPSQVSVEDLVEAINKTGYRAEEP